MHGRSLFARRAASVLVLIAASAATLLSAAPVSAHDTASGAIALVVNEHRIAATAPVPFAELGLVDTSRDGLLDADELASQQADLASRLVRTVREHVRIAIDGEDVEIIGAGVP